MPLYEYRCGTCGERFEALRRLGQGAEGLVCPRCAGRELARETSAFATSAGSSGRGCSPRGRFT